MPCAPQRIRLAAGALTSLLLAAATPAQVAYDFSGSVWTAPASEAKTRSRIQDLHKQAVAVEGPLQLRFEDERWLMLLDGEALAEGAWTHAKPKRRSVGLSLNQAGQRVLEERLTETLRQHAAAAGLEDIVVLTRLPRTRWRFSMQVDPTGASAQARIAGLVRARGEIQATIGGLPFVRPWRARLVLRTTSDPVPVANVLLEPEAGPPEPPQADFALGSSFGEVPLTVHFASTSLGTVDSFAWNFGDGGTSSVEHPVHVYTEAGVYEVELTVTGPLGSDTHRHTVIAEPGLTILPQTTLWPALQGPQHTVPRLATELTPDSYFYVGATGGFGWKFSRALEGPPSEGRAYQMVLGMDAVKPQRIRARVFIQRLISQGQVTEVPLFGPFEFNMKGLGNTIEYFFVSTLEGPQMDIQPDDRLMLELWNISTVHKKTGNLRIHLGVCTVKVPELADG